jgi:sortase A
MLAFFRITNRSKLYLKVLLFVTCFFTGFTLSLTLIDHFKGKNSPPPSAAHAAAPAHQEKKIELPVRLKIPALAIDTSIEYVGLTADGAMDLQKNPDTVAWYKLGPRPGEKGSAVIAGHYGWENGKGSVFNNLHTLQAGDKLHIEGDRGTTATFVVRRQQNYAPDADATSVFRSDDGKAHLNLVTCNGTWDNARQSYTNRLVIFTDHVTEIK